MPLKELIGSIIEEAQREAELRIEEAKKKAREMEEEARKKGEAEYSEILENAVRLSLEEKNKRLAITSIQARNALLDEKRKLIDEAFARVRQKMEELSEEEYLELMVKQVVMEASEGGGELILSPRDRKRLGEKLVSRANRMLEEKKKPGRIWLSDET
ncbi:MAG: hypothetical protein PHO53_05950, partial [Actinomycetota bacterium]|nr:hypothetical protein [Actinomycetota bacterium]